MGCPPRSFRDSTRQTKAGFAPSIQAGRQGGFEVVDALWGAGEEAGTLGFGHFEGAENAGVTPTQDELRGEGGVFFGGEGGGFLLVGVEEGVA